MVLKEPKTHLLARSENPFLRKHYLNRNLRAAAGVAGKRGGRPSRLRDQDRGPSGGSVCARGRAERAKLSGRRREQGTWSRSEESWSPREARRADPGGF